MRFWIWFSCSFLWFGMINRGFLGPVLVSAFIGPSIRPIV